MPKQLIVHDDSLEVPAPVPPAAADFDLHALAAPPIGNFAPEPTAPPGRGRKFFKMLTGKFAMSLACTAIVGTCLNIDRATRAFRFVCSFAGKFADPETSTKLEKLLHKGEEAASKVEERVDPPGEHKPSFIERKVEEARGKATGVVVERARGKVEDAKEAVVEKAHEAKQTVVEAKEKVEQKADDVVDALRQKAAERQQRGGQAPEDNPLFKRLQEQRRAQAHREQCPHCGVELHLPANAQKQRTCLNCYRPYTPAQARAAAQRGRRF